VTGGQTDGHGIAMIIACVRRRALKTAKCDKTKVLNLYLFFVCLSRARSCVISLAEMSRLY